MMLKKLSDIAMKMVLFLSILLPVIAAAGFAYYRAFTPDYLYFIFGAALGVALNICKVLMIERTIRRAEGMDPGHAKGFAGGQYLVRFMLTVAVLLVAALVPYISLVGAAAGVLSMPVAAYFANRFASDGKWEAKL
jgi:uncharacterized membrane protein